MKKVPQHNNSILNVIHAISRCSSSVWLASISSVLGKNLNIIFSFEMVDNDKIKRTVPLIMNIRQSLDITIPWKLDIIGVFILLYEVSHEDARKY